jgi:hypothetical protein
VRRFLSWLAWETSIIPHYSASIEQNLVTQAVATCQLVTRPP